MCRPLRDRGTGGSLGSTREPGVNCVLPPTVEVDALLTRIRPAQERLQLAHNLPTALRDHLRTSARIQTAPPHTRLGGSYARHVSTHQIKDVDILVLVDGSYRRLGPQRLLDDLETAVKGFAARRKPGRVERRRQRRSVRVTFSDEEFYVDLVPAMAPEGPDGVLQIPDREEDRWVRTASLRYGTLFSDLNAQAGGKLVHLVLLLRHWQLERCRNVRVKGFWLEALAVHLLRAGRFNAINRSLLEVTADAFDALYAYCLTAKRGGTVPVIPDPVLNTNVAALWAKNEFDAFFDRLDDAHTSLGSARAAGTENDAILAWQEIFGSSYFAPTPVLVQAVQATAAVATGVVGAFLLSALLRKR